MVPRAGVEPARPFGQRILKFLERPATTCYHTLPGSIYRRRYVVRVEETDKTNTAAQRVNPAIPPDAVKVVVSASGYTPASINVRLGQMVRLAFYRPDKSNCGGKVLFPALGIERELPVGRVTVVEFKAERSGRLASPVARQCIMAQLWSSN